MVYNPQGRAKEILEEAYNWVQSVEYHVTARWVFYRLLQSGTYSTKAGYKHLLGITSKARKSFYGPWRPWTLADDTRAPILMQRGGYYTLYCRGWGFKDEAEWLATLKKEINCPLDRWIDQPVYVEIWYEAAAMQGQFLHYADENIPLLAFHGDVSIAEKWRSAERLAERILAHKKPAHVYYFGDLDRKGLLIPKSAWKDIKVWVEIVTAQKDPNGEAIPFYFHRVGINQDQIERLNIPENPERPGTYQWEGLDDEAAQALIAESNELLDFDAFDEVKTKEKEILDRFKKKLEE
jgi:hypothetical protein